MGGTRSLPSWAKCPRRSGQLFLEIQREDSKDRICIDGKPGYFIGRSGKDCDIICDHKTCSRVHACLAHDEEGRLHLADLDSVHGTFLNEKELESGMRKEITPGRSLIRLGSCEWTFRVVAGPSGSPQQPSAHEASEHRGRRVDDGARPSQPDSSYASQAGRHQSGNRERERQERQRHRDRDHDSRSHREPRGHRRSERSSGHADYDTRDARHSQKDRTEKGGHAQPRDASQTQKHSGFEARNTDAGVGSSTQHLPPPGLSAATQKRKLLWGSKAAESEAGKDTEGLFGANRWDAATFSNEADKQKFIKLMGVKADLQASGLGGEHDADREVPSAGQHAKVLTDVETHFMQGLRRADGRKVGLGL